MDTVYELETFKIKLAVSEPDLAHASCAEDAAAVLRPIYAGLDADQEHFVILLLNNKNGIRGYKVISSGTLTASLVHPREVFRSAVLYGAAGFIAAHNHPSGDPFPSGEDIDITGRLYDCAEVFGIKFHDSIVLGRDSIFSFDRHGMLKGSSRAEPANSSRQAGDFRANHGHPPIGSPTGKGGKYRGPYIGPRAKRKDAGIPRGARAKQPAATQAPTHAIAPD